MFLSYHGADAKPVDEFRKLLEERGIRTFLDKEALTAGQPWPKRYVRPERPLCLGHHFSGRQILGDLRTCYRAQRVDDREFLNSVSAAPKEVRVVP